MLSAHPRALEWKRSVPALKPPQQARLKALCQAHVSDDYDNIKAALGALRPQDHLAFPSWHQQHRLALMSVLRHMQTSLAEKLARTPATFSLDGLRQLAGDIDEVSAAVGMDLNKDWGAGIEDFAAKALDLEIKQLSEGLSRNISQPLFSLCQPSNVKYTFKKWGKACRLLPAEAQGKYQSKMKAVAAEVRTMMCTSLRGVREPSESEQLRCTMALQQWEETTCNWWLDE